jgi:hypothetical protein
MRLYAYSLARKWGESIGRVNEKREIAKKYTEGMMGVKGYPICHHKTT